MKINFLRHLQLVNFYFYVKTALHHTAWKQIKILFDTTCLISSAQKNEYRIQQIWIHYSTQFGIPYNNLSMKEDVNHLQTLRYLRQMLWCHH